MSRNLQQLLDEAVRFHQNGQIEQASKRYIEIIKTNPRHADALHLLGVTASQLGQPEEAVTLISSAINVNPAAAHYHANLGLALQKLSRFTEGAACFKEALRLKPGVAENHFKLGNLFNDMQAIDEAVYHYKAAIACDKSHVAAYNNLGTVFLKQDKPAEAALFFRQAIHLSPKSDELFENLVQALRYVTFNRVDDGIRDDLIACFNHDGLDYQDLAWATISILDLSHDFNGLLALLDKGMGEADVEITPLLLPEVRNFMKDPLLITLLRKALVPNPVCERLLVNLRNLLLTSFVDHEIIDDLIQVSFLHALAFQTFLNEHVYYVSEAETRAVERLADKLRKDLKKSGLPNSLLLTLIGCYLPLHSLDCSDQLLRAAQECSDSNFNDLITLHLRHVQQEKELRDLIPTLGTFDNQISQAVRQQYEESPYPRWLTMKTNKTKPFATVVTNLFPHLSAACFRDTRAPHILVAGCGTGRHAIRTAIRFAQSNITAVDISLSSLAYAMRKARERGVSNIDFKHVDILNLPCLDMMFDHIECIGVLHHMEDPLQGWRVLTDLLREKGFMKIGLYSKLARKDITKTRSLILNKTYRSGTADEIRTYRREVFFMPDTSPCKKTLCCSNDFYTMSTTRNLIFHVQEHLFTIPQIADILELLNLEFIGFESTNAVLVKQYRDQFPDDQEGKKLSNWHLLESEHPSIFSNMYQFWVQKR